MGHRFAAQAPGPAPQSPAVLGLPAGLPGWAGQDAYRKLTRPDGNIAGLFEQNQRPRTRARIVDPIAGLVIVYYGLGEGPPGVARGFLRS
jgi:hypothetical protein